MARPYLVRRMLGRIVLETDAFIVSSSLLGSRLEVLDKRTEQVREATPAQRMHLQRCLDALGGLDVPAEPGSRPYEQLLDDFASAVLHYGQHVERAFFVLSPESRAYSAVARTRIAESAEPRGDGTDEVW